MHFFVMFSCGIGRCFSSIYPKELSPVSYEIFLSRYDIDWKFAQHKPLSHHSMLSFELTPCIQFAPLKICEITDICSTIEIGLKMGWVKPRFKSYFWASLASTDCRIDHCIILFMINTGKQCKKHGKVMNCFERESRHWSTW